MEETLVLIKPDGLENHLVGEIISRYEKEGLEIRNLKLVQPDRDLLTRHYEEHVDRSYFNDMMDFMLSGPIITLILSGEHAINRVRVLNGSTNPKEAAKGTIRGDLALDLRHNLVHGSDSAQSAKREIALWF